MTSGMLVHHVPRSAVLRNLSEKRGKELSDSLQELERLKVELAWACRMLYMLELDDITLGHITARLPGGEAVLMKPRGLGFEEVCPEDIVTIDLEGRQLAGHRGVHSETPIHTEILKRRPDVNSVIHCHSIYATAFSSVGLDVQANSHDGVLFADGVAFFDDDPELIWDNSQGAAIAECLGDRRAVLLRNHGVVVVGKDLPWAVLTAVLLEKTIKVQAIANVFGSPRPIDRSTAEKMFPTKYNDKLVANYWVYYKRRAIREGLANGLPPLDAEDLDPTLGAGGGPVTG